MALYSFSKILTRRILLRCFSSGDGCKITTAGIIVVGDEILKGDVPDTNSTYLAVELHKLGLKLKKISVIGDEVKEVSEEVKNFSNSYDYVLTSGGIGPTHDDITYEAVAMAFDEPLYLHPELREICLKFYNTTDIPKSAKLTFNAGIVGIKMTYPNVSVKNVYMFPGIPELLVKSFNILKDALFKSNNKFYSKCIYFNLTEDKIVEVLYVLVKEYPDVQFGSYPKFFHRLYKVKVTIESSNEESMKKAYNQLLTMMPKQYIVDAEDV
ncbi:hypothetical protein NQ314_014049 [Rhamnusium bicolor]|uniref:MoaB/Mog domain-containing protein n=1 Tax=Rhamnusium bicolor TaxID=1586634 RepID=A0AAV8X482_9CUCU|nr:hypothetical protein NQ314_014049 [Rhamnusium bicolor]